MFNLGKQCSKLFIHLFQKVYNSKSEHKGVFKEVNSGSLGSDAPVQHFEYFIQMKTSDTNSGGLPTAVSLWATITVFPNGL